jgi:hypothetical protein
MVKKLGLLNSLTYIWKAMGAIYYIYYDEYWISDGKDWIETRW